MHVGRALGIGVRRYKSIYIICIIQPTHAFGNYGGAQCV